MRKMTTAMGAVAAAAALTLTACGPGGPSDESSGSDAAPEGTTTIQMVESLTSPARTDLLRGLLDKCEADVPGVKVELISPPTEQADQKIQQMLQAGSGVDILEVRDTTVGSYAANSWLVDMAPYFADWDGKATLSETAQTFITDPDGVFVVPYGFFGLSLFYRTDLIKDAGFDAAPDTWDDLLAQATAIQDPAANQFGYAFRGGKNGYQQAVQVIESYLADQIDVTNAYFLKDGKTIFGTPEAKQAMELYVSLFHDAAPPSSIAWGFPEMVEGFSNGSTGFLLQDPEVITALQDSSSLTPEQWTTAPVLKGPEGKAFQAHAYSGWGIAASSEHPEQAVEIIKCLSTGELSLEFSKGNNQIPILAEASDDEFYKTGPWESYFTMSAEPDVYIAGRQPRDAAWWMEWAEIADADMQSLLLEQTSIEEVLTKWDTYWAEKGQ